MQLAVCGCVIVFAHVWLWHKLSGGVGMGDFAAYVGVGHGYSAGCVCEQGLAAQARAPERGPVVHCPVEHVEESGQSRPASRDLPGEVGQNCGAHLMMVWEDQVTVDRRKICPWEPRASGHLLGGARADVTRPSVDYRAFGSHWSLLGPLPGPHSPDLTMANVLQRGKFISHPRTPQPSL